MYLKTWNLLEGGATRDQPFSGWLELFMCSSTEGSVFLQHVAALTFTLLLFPIQCIVGVAGGATRAALTMHQARRNNMGDVSAKDSSQVNIKHWGDSEVGRGQDRP